MPPHFEVHRIALAACCAAWAASTLVRLGRALGPRRNPSLVVAWGGGCASLLAASIALAAGAPVMAVGALVFALVLPLSVLSMLMEISAFLGWIDLQRAQPRRRRVPAIGALQPEAAKARVLALHAAAGLAAVATVTWPGDIAARTTGGLLVAAYGALAATLAGAWRRERRFLAETAAITHPLVPGGP